ncbi:TWF1 [Candida jiufengensis]|uniref:TWF1 n=1 Tax=Candida jiufengensis TaxID=497108 RepID=UPI002224A25F|nr:TWF1 [Candida jiufengensis]KAI5955882.1 TWF1 [Candida jiufengensis]
MSTQSGITASKELLNDFNIDKNDKIIIIKISKDLTQLIPDENFNSTNSIDSLHSYLSKEFPQPSYIIIPYENIKIFVSFIPDSAPIKQKMLYASTKNTLITELGSNNFQYKYSFTELDEVTETYIKKCIKDDNSINSGNYKDAQTNDEAILSKLQNQSNYGYKRELASMSNKDTTSDNILFKFDSNLTDEFENSLKVDELIIFNIDSQKELIQLLKKSSNVKSTTIISEFSSLSNGPKYSIYNYSPQKYSFIYTCPSGSSVKDRMIYAASKNSLIHELKKKYFTDAKIFKNLEVGDLDELELTELEDQEDVKDDESVSSTSSSTTNNNSNNGLRFSKPKGPRRR